MNLEATTMHLNNSMTGIMIIRRRNYLQLMSMMSIIVYMYVYICGEDYFQISRNLSFDILFKLYIYNAQESLILETAVKC